MLCLAVSMVCVGDSLSAGIAGRDADARAAGAERDAWAQDRRHDICRGGGNRWWCRGLGGSDSASVVVSDAADPLGQGEVVVDSGGVPGLVLGGGAADLDPDGLATGPLVRCHETRLAKGFVS